MFVRKREYHFEDSRLDKLLISFFFFVQAKTRASILWLIAKSTDNGRIPAELRDPFYRDHKSQESLKPWITQRLANGELYGRALANIYGVPDYSCLGHQGILQLLSRRGIYVQEMGNCDEPITETLLLKTSPVKLVSVIRR